MYLPSTLRLICTLIVSTPLLAYAALPPDAASPAVAPTVITTPPITGAPTPPSPSITPCSGSKAGSQASPQLRPKLLIALNTCKASQNSGVSEIIKSANDASFPCLKTAKACTVGACYFLDPAGKKQKCAESVVVAGPLPAPSPVPAVPPTPIAPAPRPLTPTPSMPSSVNPLPAYSQIPALPVASLVSFFNSQRTPSNIPSPFTFSDPIISGQTPKYLPNTGQIMDSAISDALKDAKVLVKNMEATPVILPTKSPSAQHEYYRSKSTFAPAETAPYVPIALNSTQASPTETPAPLGAARESDILPTYTEAPYEYGEPTDEELAAMGITRDEWHMQLTMSPGDMIAFLANPDIPTFDPGDFALMMMLDTPPIESSDTLLTYALKSTRVGNEIEIDDARQVTVSNYTGFEDTHIYSTSLFERFTSLFGDLFSQLFKGTR